MGAFPAAKLGLVLIKQISKPIANSIAGRAMAEDVRSPMQTLERNVDLQPLLDAIASKASAAVVQEDSEKLKAHAVDPKPVLDATAGRATAEDVRSM